MINTTDDMIRVLSEGNIIRENTIDRLKQVVSNLDRINREQEELLDSIMPWVESEDCPINIRHALLAIHKSLSTQIHAIANIKQ